MADPDQDKFDYAVLTSLDGNAVKIGLDRIFISTPPEDLLFNFQVELQDQDRDTASAGFSVGIDADGVAGIDPNIAALSLQPNLGLLFL